MLELGGVTHSTVVGNLLVDLGAEEMLVTEHISHALLVNRHALLVSILHGLLVVTVPVLEFEVGLL